MGKSVRMTWFVFEKVTWATEYSVSYRKIRIAGGPGRGK